MSMFIYAHLAGTHLEASAASRDATRAESKARRASSEIAILQSRLDRLALVTQALWSLLEERVGVSELELIERVREIDLSDGVLDGRAKPGVQDCPRCGRVLSKRNPRCIYCGTEVERNPFGSV